MGYLLAAVVIGVPFLFGLWLGHSVGEQQGWQKGYNDTERWNKNDRR